MGGWICSSEKEGEKCHTLLLYKVNSEELTMAFHDAANNELQLEFDFVGLVACNCLSSDLVRRFHSILFDCTYR